MEAAKATEPAEDAGGLRMKLEFSVWRKSFDRAHTAWANAPAELKPALLLSGADLARAESWLVDFSEKLSDSERRFILKSKTMRRLPHGPGHARQPVEKRGALYYLKVYSGPMLSVVFVAVLITIRIFGPQVVDDMVEKSNAEFTASKGARGESRTAGSGETSKTEAAQTTTAPSRGWLSPGKTAVERLAQTPPASVSPPPAPMLDVPTAGLSRIGRKVAQLEHVAAHRWQTGEKDVALRFAVEALGSALDGGDPMVRAETARTMVFDILARKAGAIAKPAGAAAEPATFPCAGGDRLLIADETRHLRRWQIEPPMPLGQGLAQPAGFESAAIDHACDRIAVPGEEHSAEILSVATGRKLATLEGHEAPVLASAFSPDGRLVATASQDNTIRLWDAASGRLQKVLSGHDGAVASVTFSPDGRLLATGSEDGTARLWTVPGGRELHRLAGHAAAVASTIFLGDGSRLLTVSRDGTAAIWDAATGKRQRVLTTGSGSIFAAVADPAGTTVAAATDNGRVRIWQTDGDRAVDVVPGGDEPVRALVLSPAGGMLLTLGWNGTAGLWNTATGDGVARMGENGTRIAAAVFRPDGKSFTALLADGSLASWPVVESSRALLSRGREALPGCESNEQRPGYSRPAWCRPLVQSAE